jgi:tetratricopeptide (TPR) repeat protein
MAWLDLSISRARATAARFHPVTTPLLVCLSPHGVIISRDTESITESLILERMQHALARSPELDAKLDLLEKAADNETDTDAQMQLADFLMDRKNAFEAIPVLAAVAHLDTVDSALRVRAWEELGQAHLWVGEAEKAHFEAQNLMATLGPVTPEARAAGNLVLGNQDAANPIRFARARQEYEAAVAAAPDSTYGKQAATALANLPKADFVR